MRHITILGGTAGFGLWTAEFLQRKFPGKTKITITGNDEKKGNEVVKNFGFKYVKNNVEAVQGADIVIFSVPISKTEAVIREVAPFVKKDAIVLDVTSVKKMPDRVMKECFQTQCIIPTHPMFGPYIIDIAGQIIVLCPDKNTQKDERYIALKEFLMHEGAEIIETTSEDNDKMMAIVQGLTHFTMFVVGETIAKYDFNIEKSLNFVSPIYKLMIASVARYIGQNPVLYADIQMYNDEILTVHEKFLETSSEFHTSVKSKNRDDFINKVLTARNFFTQKNCDFGQKYTDKLIFLMTEQEKNLQNNIGKEIQLQHIYTKEKRKGVLEKNTLNSIQFEGENLDKNEWVILYKDLEV